MLCPLCANNKCTALGTGFSRCSECQLIFKSVYLTKEQERARYETHENSIENEGYVKFLTPALEAVVDRARAGAQGLDYGCGPQPVLAHMLNQKGFVTGYYDPFFFPEGLKLDKKFDFITCTEAAEHFFKPHKEFEKIFSLLKPNGFAVVMTEMFHESMDIESWYYAKDPTHVCFYSRETILWIAKKFNRNVEILSSRLIVFTN